MIVLQSDDDSSEPTSQNNSANQKTSISISSESDGDENRNSNNLKQGKLDGFFSSGPKKPKIDNSSSSLCSQQDEPRITKVALRLISFDFI